MPSVKFSGGGIIVGGCFSGARLDLVVPMKRTLLLWHTKAFWTISCSQLCGNSLKIGNPVTIWLCPSAQRKVHKGIVVWVWCGRMWLVCTDSWSQRDRTPLEWIRNTPKHCGKPSQKIWRCCNFKGWTKIKINWLRMGCQVHSFFFPVSHLDERNRWLASFFWTKCSRYTVCTICHFTEGFQ